MKMKFILSACLCLFISAATAQTDGLEFKVLAVNGQVYHYGQALKKNDVFKVTDAGELIKGFHYGTASDWIKVMEIKSGSTRTCYAQQQRGSKNHYLFTRSSEAITNDNELLYFFKRPSIFLFNSDTLMCEGLQKFKTDSNHLLMLQYSAGGKTIRKTIAKNDSLILSEQIFVTEAGRISSFAVDSIRLLCFDVLNNKSGYPELSPFCIYFFGDVVNHLKKTGMKQDEIFAELTTHFVSIEEIQKQQGFKDKTQAETWLKEKIRQQ